MGGESGMAGFPLSAVVDGEGLAAYRSITGGSLSDALDSRTSPPT